MLVVNPVRELLQEVIVRGPVSRARFSVSVRHGNSERAAQETRLVSKNRPSVSTASKLSLRTSILNFSPLSIGVGDSAPHLRGILREAGASEPAFAAEVLWVLGCCGAKLQHSSSRTAHAPLLPRSPFAKFA